MFFGMVAMVLIHVLTVYMKYGILTINLKNLMYYEKKFIFDYNANCNPGYRIRTFGSIVAQEYTVFNGTIYTLSLSTGFYEIFSS